MPLESSITGSIIGYLNSLPYARAEKLKGSGTSSGRADINACYRGKMLRIEVKTPDHKNDASKKQEHNLHKWYKAGAIVIVAYSLNSVKWFLQMVDTCYSADEGLDLVYLERNGCISWVKRKGKK